MVARPVLCGPRETRVPTTASPTRNAVTSSRTETDSLWRSGFPPPEPTASTAPRSEYLSDQTFLRGRQHTDRAGMLEFATIYPGWYPGRTVHIHLMVHANDRVFTSQLYFPDPVSNHVLASPPYAERPDRDTTNDTDEIFPTEGEPAVLDVHPSADRGRAGICLVVPAEAAGVP